MTTRTITEHELFEMVAERLCGMPVTVRRRPTLYANPGIDGVNFKTKTSAAIIDIAPDAVDPVWTLCHEAAHLRTEWNRLPGTDAWQLPPRSLKLTTAGQAAKRSAHRPREEEADRLARRWMEYTNAHFKSYGDKTTSDLHRKLLCLCDINNPFPAWRADEMTSQAAARAVKQLSGLRSTR